MDDTSTSMAQNGEDPSRTTEIVPNRDDGVRQDPPFLTHLDAVPNVQVYQPFRPSRQGEIIAWCCAVASVITTAVRWTAIGRPEWGILVFMLMFLGSAGLISFGNMVTFRTRITLDHEGVRFESPLRKTWLEYDHVEAMTYNAWRSGWRIQVESSQGHFHFDTPGLLGAGSSRAEQIGIENGEALAAGIWVRSGLSSPELAKDTWICRRVEPEA